MGSFCWHIVFGYGAQSRRIRQSHIYVCISYVLSLRFESSSKCAYSVRILKMWMSFSASFWLGREPGNSRDWLCLMSLRYSCMCRRIWIIHPRTASPFRFRFLFRLSINFIPEPKHDRDSGETWRKYIVHPIQKRRSGDGALSLVPRLGFLLPLTDKAGREKRSILNEAAVHCHLLTSPSLPCRALRNFWREKVSLLNVMWPRSSQ